MEYKKNSILLKLEEESDSLFKKCIPLIEDNQNIKKRFYDFLFNDIIQNKSKNNIKINNIFTNQSEIINGYLEEISLNISNFDENLFKELKKKLTKNKENIKNKITECKSHIEIIKKAYINIILNKYLSSNNSMNFFSFENKKVLCLKEDENLVLSEFFARFIFCLIEIDEMKNIKNMRNIDIKDLFKNFYNDNNINSYINREKDKINDFDNINNNFKYLIVLLFLIENIFSNNSRYNSLFNIDEFIKYINNILTSIVTPKNEPKKKKNNKKILQILQEVEKAKKGGGEKNKKKKDSEIKKSITNILIKHNTKTHTKPHTKTDTKPQTKTDNKIKILSKIKNLSKLTNKLKNKDLNKLKNPSLKINYIAICDKILNNTYLYDQPKRNLNNIYYPSFKNNIKEYFLKIFHSNIKKNNFLKKKFLNPFNNQKNISINDIIIDTGKNNIPYTTISSFFTENNIRFNLYESFNLLLKNKESLNKFIKQIERKIILILFYLYNIKLNIYNLYIDKIDNIIKNNNKSDNISNNTSNNTSNNKSDNKSDNTSNNKSDNTSNNTSNNKSNNTSNNKSNNTSNNKNKTNIINNYNSIIKKKKSEIKKLKDDSGIKNYDKKILLLESELNKLIIDKYTTVNLRD